MNICADCKRIMDCSWEREFVPVQGWTAKAETQTYIDNGVTVEVETFDVIDCPLFIPPSKKYRKRTKFQDKEAYRRQIKEGKMVKGQSIETGETKVWTKMTYVQRDGFNPARVSECANGKKKHHKGWRFWLISASTVEKKNNNEAKGESE